MSLGLQYHLPYSAPMAMNSFVPEPQQPRVSGGGISLVIQQQPEHAKVAGGKDKDRKPIDPPPVVQLVTDERNFDRSLYGRPDACLQNPYYFVDVALLADDLDGKQAKQEQDVSKALHGTTVSSLHKVKSMSGIEGGYFIFGDLSVKTEGFYRLRFSLYELRGEDTYLVTSTTSLRFQVHTQRSWPGMKESTDLTRHLSDQGVRLRVRKDSKKVHNRKRHIDLALDSDERRSEQVKRQRPDMYPSYTPSRTQSGDSLVNNMSIHSPIQGLGRGIDYDTYSSPYSTSMHYPNYIATSGAPRYQMPLTPSSTGMTSQASQSTTQSPPYLHSATDYGEISWQNELPRHQHSPVTGMTGLGF
ncbi:Spore development regulator VOSA [Colletotrichum spinosum]|uniref:Spore development regulator VOSA n=1 Tax=Colletotrichum spinosum TaxID=1347390 RepID=A0A4R8Q0U6_9PEZI|nr:Spore development regulator VOSA [Colletotrichum spinosum]